MQVRDASDVGQAVRAIRKRLGATQPDLALTAGTGVRFIVDLERGKPTCQLGRALQVLTTLGATIEVTSVPGDDPEPRKRAES